MDRSEFHRYSDPGGYVAGSGSTHVHTDIYSTLATAVNTTIPTPTNSTTNTEHKPNMGLSGGLIETSKEENNINVHEHTEGTETISNKTRNNMTEIVQAAVDNTDDPTAPSITFRSLTLGIFFVTFISFVNQFYWERDNPITLNLLIVQLLCYPLGVAMARVLPKRIWCLFGYKWTMNPGPFNVKEHVLISLMSNSSANMALTVDIFAVLRLYYDPGFPLYISLLLLLSGQFFAYAVAGLSRALLVHPASMVWPSSLVNASLFRTFHEHKMPYQLGEQRSGVAHKFKFTRMQFFWICFSVSFIWYFVPGYFIRILSSISPLCLIAPNNHLANLVGDGKRGLGILSFSLDWSVFSNAFLGSPIATPFWAACNLFSGFVLMFWIALPIGYFKDLWGSSILPIYSSHVFAVNGTLYNVSKVMDNGVFDPKGYERYSPLRMPLEFSWVYGTGFAALASILVHTAIYNGREIITRIRKTKETHGDVHGRFISRYPKVKPWWYLVMLTTSCTVGIGAGVSGGIGVPWWGYLLGFSITVVLVVPVGIIQAISNRQPGLSIVSELLSGVVLQGVPTGYSILKLFGHGSLAQALSYAQDMKLGHYMKIPPRHIFLYQTFGILISAVVQSCVFFWLINHIPDMCHDNGYPWTCRSTNLVYSASIIWNLIGPLRVFGRDSPYRPLLWGFLIGALMPLPIYMLQRSFSSKRWLKNIYVPVILSGIVGLPPMPPVDFPMWFLFGLVINWAVRKYRYCWWKSYNFTLSAALDSGLALSGIFQFLALSQNGLTIRWDGNDVDSQCPLSGQPWKSV